MTKYDLQRKLYNRLAIGENMASEYNQVLLKAIWSLSVKDLRSALND
jgi:hypothetical protein